MMNRVQIMMFNVLVKVGPVLVFLVGCGEIKDAAQYATINGPQFILSYETGYGLKVSDPDGVTNADAIDETITETIGMAPESDANKIAERLAKMQLFVVDSETVTYVCPGNTQDAVGCINGDTMWIANRDCMWHVVTYGQPTASILAHEIGHAIGHGGHSYTPWFGDDGHGGMEASIAAWACPGQP